MLPDPDQYPDHDLVIYDGRCGFCQNQVNNLRRLDWGNQRLAFISLHDERVATRYPDLSHDRLMSEMVVIDRSGKEHGGADAVRYLSRRLPVLWPAVPILHLPGSARLWRWFYGQIAKKRYWLSEKFFGGDPTCDGGSCSIHFAKPSKTKQTDS